MNNWYRRLLVVATACLGLFPFAASATLITYEFSVTATTGPLIGTTAKGTFSYDSSIIPATLPGFVSAPGLLTALDFTWDGIHYTAATANTGVLVFDAGGNLSGELFGTNCDPVGGCSVTYLNDEWFVNGSLFAYATPSSFVEEGTVVITRVPTVPEPGTLALFALAFAAFGFARRERT